MTKTPGARLFALFGLLAAALIFDLSRAAAATDFAFPVAQAMLLVAGLPFSNVVATGTATSSFPLGMSFNRVLLQLGGGSLTKAMITDIKVRVNGKVIFQNTGSRLDSVNAYRGLASAATFLTVDFTEPRYKRMEDQYLGNINTAQGVSSVTMDVAISGATTPSLTPYYELNGPAPLGVIAKQIIFTMSVSASGKQPFKLIDAANAGALIKRVHFAHGGNMTQLEVKKNGIVIFDNIPTAVLTQHALDYGRTIQANLYSYDPCVDQNGANMIVTKDARSMEFNPTYSAADTNNAVVEVVDVIGNM